MLLIPSFAERYAAAGVCSKEPHVRKSVADADRRRATDASSRRSIGVDSVLELQHRHFQLQQTLDGLHRTVLSLEQRASQLRTARERLRAEGDALDVMERALQQPDPEDEEIVKASVHLAKLEAEQNERQ